jgi:hypothetical protein
MELLSTGMLDTGEYGTAEKWNLGLLGRNLGIICELEHGFYKEGWSVYWQSKSLLVV